MERAAASDLGSVKRGVLGAEHGVENKRERKKAEAAFSLRAVPGSVDTRM